MTKSKPARFHKLYGLRKPKITYFGRDFLDYALMISLSALVIIVSYGLGRVMGILGLALCVFMVAMFIRTHGVQFRVPVILRRPQEVLHLFIYKLENAPPVFFMAVRPILLENLLIPPNPNLPPHLGSIRQIAFHLFFVHFIRITLYRTTIFVPPFPKK